MKKKLNRKILILLFVLALLIGCGTVYAAYRFSKIVTIKADNGKIAVDEKSFLNFANSDNLTGVTGDASKLRKDTVLVVEEIKLNRAEATYKKFTGTADVNTVYYEKNITKVTPDSQTSVKGLYTDENCTSIVTDETKKGDGTTTYYKLDYSIISIQEGTVISDNAEIYVNRASYTGIKEVGKSFDKDLNSINCIYTEGVTDVVFSFESSKTRLSYQVKLNFSSLTGKVTKAEVINTTATNLDYKVVINSNANGFVVLDNNITNEALASNSYNAFGDTNKVTCSATEEKYDPTNIYLNQLGFKFSFTPTVAVYVRIKFEDAWLRTRLYASGPKQMYIVKDQVAGVSPFRVDDENWYYDEKENYAYYKGLFLPQLNDEGVYLTQSYMFGVNQAYYYIPSTTVVYTEYVQVEVSFVVDIIQANRAEEVWGINPLEIGSSN